MQGVSDIRESSNGDSDRDLDVRGDSNQDPDVKGGGVTLCKYQLECQFETALLTQQQYLTSQMFF